MAAEDLPSNDAGMEHPDTAERHPVPARRRLFVAVAIDERLRKAASGVAAQLRAHGVRGRYVDPENYHVTVAFLGSVAAPAVSGVAALLSDAARAAAPMSLSFDTVGAFPNRKHPRVAWIGTRERHESFAALCASVRDALSSLEVSLQPHDDAHVTPMRCERDAPPLPAVEFAAPAVHLDAITLFESHLGPRGPRYTRLATLPLRNG